QEGADHEEQGERDHQRFSPLQQLVAAGVTTPGFAPRLASRWLADSRSLHSSSPWYPVTCGRESCPVSPGRRLTEARKPGTGRVPPRRGATDLPGLASTWIPLTAGRDPSGR